MPSNDFSQRTSTSRCPSGTRARDSGRLEPAVVALFIVSDIVASATSDAGNGSICDLANRDALVGGRERRLPLLFRFRFMATNSFGLILFPSYACEQPGRSVVTATTNSRTEVHLYLPAARQQKLEVLPQTPRETQCRSLIPFQSSATAKSFV